MVGRSWRHISFFCGHPADAIPNILPRRPISFSFFLLVWVVGPRFFFVFPPVVSAVVPNVSLSCRVVSLTARFRLAGLYYVPLVFGCHFFW